MRNTNVVSLTDKRSCSSDSSVRSRMSDVFGGGLSAVFPSRNEFPGQADNTQASEQGSPASRSGKQANNVVFGLF